MNVRTGASSTTVVNSAPFSLQTLALVWDEDERNVIMWNSAGSKTIHFSDDNITIFDVEANDPSFSGLQIGAMLYPGNKEPSEYSYAKIYAVLSMGRKLSEEELLGICRVFGAC